MWNMYWIVPLSALVYRTLPKAYERQSEVPMCFNGGRRDEVIEKSKNGCMSFSFSRDFSCLASIVCRCLERSTMQERNSILKMCWGGMSLPTRPLERKCDIELPLSSSTYIMLYCISCHNFCRLGENLDILI